MILNNTTIPVEANTWAIGGAWILYMYPKTLEKFPEIVPQTQEYISFILSLDSHPHVLKHLETTIMQKLSQVKQDNIIYIWEPQYFSTKLEEDSIILNQIVWKNIITIDLSKLNYDALNTLLNDYGDNICLYSWFALSELKQAISSQGFDESAYQKIRDLLLSMPTINPMSHDETLSDRWFREKLNLCGLWTAFTFVKTFSSTKQALIKTINSKNIMINQDGILDQHVLKLDDTCSGQGVKIKPSLLQVLDAIDSYGKVTFEPIISHPLLDSQLLATEQEWLWKYWFDTRIRISIDAEGSFSYQHPAVRANTLGVPTNIWAWWFFMHCVIVSNDSYKSTYESVQSYENIIDTEKKSIDRLFNAEFASVIRTWWYANPTTITPLVMSEAGLFNHLMTAISGYMQIENSTGENPWDVAFDMLGHAHVELSIPSESYFDIIKNYISACKKIQSDNHLSIAEKNKKIHQQKLYFMLSE